MSAAELKQLQTRKANLEAELRRLQEEHSERAGQINTTKQKLTSVDRQIADLTPADVIVSEHAMLRYIERVVGIDLDAIRAQILGDGREAMVRKMGSGKYPLGRHKVVVKGRTVVTVE